MSGRLEISKARSFEEREISLLIRSELSIHASMKKGFNIIMIGTKIRDIAKTQISNSLNELLDTKTAPKQSSVSQKL